jgi:hypothetical protein
MLLQREEEILKDKCDVKRRKEDHLRIIKQKIAIIEEIPSMRITTIL